MTKSDYSKKDIINALTNVGITNNDNIFIHSNIGFFGQIESARDKEDLYRAFKKAIFEVIGENGTLIVPVFSYSFCWNKVFDKDTTPGICGIFSEMVRKDPCSIRSDDANFSIAAIGKNAEYFIENMPEHSFGKNSFWERFLLCNGKFCNFNFDSGSTFIHYVEKLLNIKYRYDKKFSGIYKNNGIEIEKAFYHFVYDLSKPSNGPDFTKFDKLAKELRITKTENLGKGQIVCISAKDTLELIRSEIQKNPTFLIIGSKIQS